MRAVLAIDKFRPILEGSGQTDYARYMRTDDLLSLQRCPDEMAHPDELLFQTVHQSTELWLKHASFEIDQAVQDLDEDRVEESISHLVRAITGAKLITQQLEMLNHMTPADFQKVRTQLGNGSGFESPGWRRVMLVSAKLGRAFNRYRRAHQVDLVELYGARMHTPSYRLAESLVEWDERISLWRIRHFRIAVRTIGIEAVGTKGTPVSELYRLISRNLFPDLWQVRSKLTVLMSGCDQTTSNSMEEAECPI